MQHIFLQELTIPDNESLPQAEKSHPTEILKVPPMDTERIVPLTHQTPIEKPVYYIYIYIYHILYIQSFTLGSDQ